MQLNSVIKEKFYQKRVSSLDLKKSEDKIIESFENYSLDTWKEVMSVNVDAMFLTAKAVGKIMVGDKMGGSIVQIASIYGLVGTDASIYEGSKYLGCQINTPAVYSTSKAAVLGMTKYLSTYWGNSGIRVNSISPGGVFSGQNDEFVSRYSSKVPMARMGDKKEMAICLVLNADADLNKVLRVIEFNSIVRNNQKQDIATIGQDPILVSGTANYNVERDKTISAFRIKNEYQDTKRIQYSSGRIKRRFDKWRVKVPRDDRTINRMRSTYFELTLYFDNTENRQIIIGKWYLK